MPGIAKSSGSIATMWLDGVAYDQRRVAFHQAAVRPATLARVWIATEDLQSENLPTLKLVPGFPWWLRHSTKAKKADCIAAAGH
jgi:hypothetical protein